MKKNSDISYTYHTLVPSAARLAQPNVQVSKIRYEAFTFLRQNGFILLLTGLAPDAQLRLVLMSMGNQEGL